MLEKVLFATDFSECSGKALEFLKKLKDVGEVVVLHVVDEKEIFTIVTNVVWIGETTKEYEDELRRKLKSKAKEEMEKLREELEKEGFMVEVKIVEGRPAEKIVEIAEIEKTELIIMGSHGKSNLRDVLIGSVSEGVLRRTKVPVTIVKRDSVI